jgi:hypothetical protein
MSDKFVNVMPKHEVMVDRLFAEDVWELAFGDNAFKNGYTHQDVLHTLRDYERKALAWDMLADSVDFEYPEDDTQYAYDLRETMDTYLGEV